MPRLSTSPTSPTTQPLPIVSEALHPESSGSQQMKGLGIKEMDQTLSTLHRQNFDLKLEVYHRRERQNALEERHHSIRGVDGPGSSARTQSSDATSRGSKWEGYPARGPLRRSSVTAGTSLAVRLEGRRRRTVARLSVAPRLDRPRRSWVDARNARFGATVVRGEDEDEDLERTGRLRPGVSGAGWRRNFDAPVGTRMRLPGGNLTVGVFSSCRFPPSLRPVSSSFVIFVLGSLGLSAALLVHARL